MKNGILIEKDDFHVDMSGRIYEGRNIGSFADNYARIYRRKALKPKKLSKGKELRVIEIKYKLIKQYWEELK